MSAYFGPEHLHSLETPNGDRVCIDIQWALGKVFSVSWYTGRETGAVDFVYKEVA